MCGLVGIASKHALYKATLSVFDDLLHLDTLRGPHSTGVIAVNTKMESDWYKMAIKGTDFVKEKGYKDWRPSTTRVLFGHNRWATMGKSDDVKGAHPFEHGDITGMHNGTLWYHEALPDGKQFTVDSEAIIHFLSKVEPDDVTTVTKELDGAFALSWWDERDNSINFVRNKERPLYLALVYPKFGDTKTPTTLLWASEKHMLYSAATRERSNLSFCDEDQIKCFELPVGKHFKYLINEAGFEFNHPVVKDVELCTTTSYSNQSYLTGNRWGYHYGQNFTSDKGLSAHGKLKELGWDIGDIIYGWPLNRVGTQSTAYFETTEDDVECRMYSGKDKMTPDDMLYGCNLKICSAYYEVGFGGKKKLILNVQYAGDKQVTNRPKQSLSEATAEVIRLFDVSDTPEEEEIEIGCSTVISKDTWDEIVKYRTCGVCGSPFGSDPKDVMFKGDELIHTVCESTYKYIVGD